MGSTGRCLLVCATSFALLGAGLPAEEAFQEVVVFANNTKLNP